MRAETQLPRFLPLSNYLLAISKVFADEISSVSGPETSQHKLILLLLEGRQILAPILTLDFDFP